MPPARSATAAPRRQPRPAPRRKPHRVALRSPKLRVRWERVGRFGLLFVLAVVVGLYVEHTLSYFSTRSQADQQQAIVNQLSHQNQGLARELKSLNDPQTIVRDARALGMVRPGERSYAMTGQPQR
jgi:cell division protein FtsB